MSGSSDWDSIFVKGGMRIDIDGTDSLNFTELANQDDRESSSDQLLLTVQGYVNSDDDLEFNYSNKPTALSDDNDDNNYYITTSGTYMITDEGSDDKGKVNFYVPNSEVQYKASVNIGQTSTKLTERVSADRVDERFLELQQEGYTVTKTAVEKSNVEFDVSAPINDVNAGSSDNIVVGGPAVNSKARELLGAGVVGVDAGQAVVRYFSSSNSILVYGYSKAGTLAAAKKLVSNSAQDGNKFNE